MASQEELDAIKTSVLDSYEKDFEVILISYSMFRIVQYSKYSAIWFLFPVHHPHIRVHVEVSGGFKGIKCIKKSLNL